MRLYYLDSSAVVKRYIIEPGSDLINEVYNDALNGDILLSFSIWNIGEVLGVLDRYQRRGWLSHSDYLKARLQFLGETQRLLKLRILKITPVRAKLLIQTWSLIEKYQIYEADALQILSAKQIGAEKLYTGDKLIHDAASKEGLKSRYIG